jgi:hypothetical protein
MELIPNYARIAITIIDKKINSTSMLLHFMGCVTIHIYMVYNEEKCMIPLVSVGVAFLNATI